MTSDAEWWVPGWAAPPNVRAITTTCLAGNLAVHTGDDPQTVERNRARLIGRAGVNAVQWLDQVHGRHVVRADGSTPPPSADAVWTDARELGCVVLSADCVPVFVCADDGGVVAVAHGGWRGLVGGVLDALVDALPVPSSRLMAWLGPAIGHARYEVGVDVAQALRDGCGRGIADRVLTARGTKKWLADLSLLARLQLEDLGVRFAGTAGICTYDDPRCYSHRRDRTRGRMASMIWLAGR